MFDVELDTNDFNCQTYNTKVTLNFSSNTLLKHPLLNAHFNEILKLQCVLFFFFPRSDILLTQ